MAELAIRYPDLDTSASIAYKIQTPFIPHVLGGELAVEHGVEPIYFAYVFEGDSSKASEDNPVTVWLPDITNDRKLKRVLAQHDTTPAEPPLQSVKDKLSAGETLSLAEVSLALSYLLKV